MTDSNSINTILKLLSTTTPVVKYALKEKQYYIPGSATKCPGRHRIWINVEPFNRISCTQGKKILLGQQLRDRIPTHIQVLSLCLRVIDQVSSNKLYMSKVIEAQIEALRYRPPPLSCSTAHKSSNRFSDRMNENKIIELTQLNYDLQAEFMIKGSQWTTA